MLERAFKRLLDLNRYWCVRIIRQAMVLAVLKENGDAVRQGDLLVRLDQTAIRDSLTSAEASARAAGLDRNSLHKILRRLGLDNPAR